LLSLTEKKEEEMNIGNDEEEDDNTMQMNMDVKDNDLGMNMK
jgi:hypothetical protein